MRVDLKEHMVFCNRQCDGTQKLCFPEIQERLDKGNNVLMIYTTHVKEHFEKNYEIKVGEMRDIPVVMRILAKGEN